MGIALNKLKTAVLSAFLVAASQAGAVTTGLGLLGTGDTEFSNSFWSTGTFTDYYTFTLGSTSGGVGGSVLTTDLSLFTRDLDVTQLTLSGGTLASTLVDSDASNGFSFNGLGAGNYTMALTVNVGNKATFFSSYGAYQGTIHAQASTAPVASPAPEPADFAMALMGLAGVGFMVRRRRSAR